MDLREIFEAALAANAESHGEHKRTEPVAGHAATPAATLLLGDCLEKLRTLADNSVDSVVTDPPYGLSFMGKKWDYDVPSVDIWREVLRVLKPGGHLLAFAGTRTYHRMAVNIEDAGFEIRDSLSWLYGSGFPKSHNISKAIDRAAGAEREITGPQRRPDGSFRTNIDKTEGTSFASGSNDKMATSPATDAAKQWDGWGTALKPAHEPICLAQKPISEKTIASNVLKWGVGGLNIDATRIEAQGRPARENVACGYQTVGSADGTSKGNKAVGVTDLGRFPSNLLLGCAPTCTDDAHDMLECPIFRLDEQSGVSKSQGGSRGAGGKHGKLSPIGAQPNVKPGFGDVGSASRFFYCAKSSKRERNEGCEGLPEKIHAASGGAQASGEGYDQGQGIGLNRVSARTNFHPTVKPIALMRYLCRLVTPPNGTVLDPFTGSGSTGVAALREGFRFIGVEREPEYHAIASARIEATHDPL